MERDRYFKLHLKNLVIRFTQHWGKSDHPGGKSDQFILIAD
jgi:hypothetical protein